MTLPELQKLRISCVCLRNCVVNSCARRRTVAVTVYGVITLARCGVALGRKLLDSLSFSFSLCAAHAARCGQEPAAEQDVPRLPAPLYVAKEVGAVLGCVPKPFSFPPEPRDLRIMYNVTHTTLINYWRAG